MSSTLSCFSFSNAMIYLSICHFHLPIGSQCTSEHYIKCSCFSMSLSHYLLILEFTVQIVGKSFSFFSKISTFYSFQILLFFISLIMKFTYMISCQNLCRMGNQPTANKSTRTVEMKGQPIEQKSNCCGQSIML